ncbi:hypothetical protein LZF95_23005 [Algoriphagus sp. AGSA1]|nr:MULTISPECIES: hypothetical protein [unclassified Algoriphagus]MCE7057569.1 hypothetical protein [Algoriphagus sp. AGSA1]
MEDIVRKCNELAFRLRLSRVVGKPHHAALMETFFVVNDDVKNGDKDSRR